MKDKIKWPAGNRLDLCIPLRKITVTEEGTQFGEYIPSQAAVVMVYFVGNYASYEYTPRIEDNKLFITDNGELKQGVYAIDVRIQEPERKLRSFRCGELEIVRETKQLALGDFVLDNNITLDADAFIFGEGPSAFEVAVRDGYTGTKAEWLESLRGREGRGIADIVALPTGAFRILLTDGSAYVTPTLKGEQGVSIVDFTVSSITSQEVLCTITMSDGATRTVNLPRGEKGEQGDAGEDGRGIQSVVMNNDYTITFSYTDGTSYTTPQALRGEQGAAGQDGQDGRGISSMALDDDNHLTVSYSDGTTYTTPQSLQGERGVGITDFEQVGENATMCFFNIYYSNGNISQIGLPKGEQGDRGEQGPQGPKGDTVVLGEVGEYKLYNIGGTATDGAMTQDATTKAIAANTGYYECSTASGTAAKVAVGDNEALYTLQKGGSIKVKMTNANSAASGVTLKVGSANATPLYYNGAAVSASNTWEAGEVISVYYDGTNYQASNAHGSSNKETDAYLYGDLRTLAVGQTYEKGEAVKTDDGMFLSMTQRVQQMDLGDSHSVGDLKAVASGANLGTYQALKAVASYNDGNTYTEGDYAIFDGVLKKYDGTEWADVTLSDYVTDASMWIARDVAWLTGNAAQQNSVNKSLEESEKPVAIILSNHERRIAKNETSKMGEEEELVIARALQASSNGGGGENSLSGSVTIRNSDCIMIIGSSFGAGYTMTGKHWTDIVSMFSDYCFQNVSLSGTSSLDRMNSLLAGTITPRLNAKYAMVVNNENTSVNHKYLLKEIDNLCKVCLSFGMEPIVGTSYRNYLGNYQENMYVSSLYRDYCEKHNYIFMDAAEQYQLLMKGRYDFNKGGSHIGEREIPVVAYAYMDALHGMERPVKSIKVFMPRASIEDMDALVFNDKVGRAKRFKEYLMNNYTDSNLTFPLGYALISATIPSEQKNTKVVELEIEPSTDVTVYARKTNQRPWPTKANLCTRFHIEDEISVPAVNDTYTYNGSTFTVKHVNTQAEDGSYGTFCDIYCTPNLSSGTTTGGTLVRASGSGEASIDFSSYNVDTTYTPDSELVASFNGGHWVEIEPNDKGKYSLTDLAGIMDIDRVDFLVKSDNGDSFHITSNAIKVNWSASELKTNYRRLPVEKFHCHFVSGGQELLPEPTFGAEGTTQSTWKDGQGNYLVSEANYEKAVKGSSGVYPMDATSIIKVSDSVSMNYTIPAASLPDYGQIEVEVVARNFGDSINSVTTDSWDFNELRVGFGGAINVRTYSELSEQVGLFWKICHFTIDIMYYTGASMKRQLPLKIYAEKSGMEIARVSVKVKTNN